MKISAGQAPSSSPRRSTSERRTPGYALTVIVGAAVVLLGTGCAATQQRFYRRQQLAAVVLPRTAEELSTALVPVVEHQGLGVTRFGTAFLSRWKRQSDGTFTQLRITVDAVDPRHSRLRAERIIRKPYGLGASNIELSKAKSISHQSGSGAGNASMRMRVENLSLEQGDLGDQDRVGSVVRTERDLELEWALLEEVDRHTARTIEAEAKAWTGQDDGRPRVKLDAKARAQVGWICPREVEQGNQLVALRRLVLLGEQQGTNEIPGFVADLACAAVREGIPVTVAVELPASEQARVDAYLASDGSLAAKRQLLGGAAWRRMYDDGRTSTAVLELIDRVRRLRSSGVPVQVAYFDAPGLVSSERDAAMADTLEALRATHGDDVVLVLTGNAHVPKLRGAPWDPQFVPLGQRALDLGLRPLSLVATYPGGMAWACLPKPAGGYACGPSRIAANTALNPSLGLTAPAPVNSGLSMPGRGGWNPHGDTYLALRVGVRLEDETDAQGLDGHFFVGTLSASPPAVDSVRAAEAGPQSER